MIVVVVVVARLVRRGGGGGRGGGGARVDSREVRASRAVRREREAGAAREGGDGGGGGAMSARGAHAVTLGRHERADGLPERRLDAREGTHPTPATTTSVRRLLREAIIESARKLTRDATCDHRRASVSRVRFTVQHLCVCG